MARVQRWTAMATALDSERWSRRAVASSSSNSSTGRRTFSCRYPGRGSTFSGAVVDIARASIPSFLAPGVAGGYHLLCRRWSSAGERGAGMAGTRQGLTFSQVVKRLRAIQDGEESAEQLAAFEMGDLLVGVLPLGEGERLTARVPALDPYAKGADIDVGVLEQRRFVSGRVPAADRTGGITWSVFREVATAEDAERARLLVMIRGGAPGVNSRRWTVNAIRARMGRKPILHPAEPISQRLAGATVEEKAETAAALLRDPEVRAVARDVGTDLGGAVFGM